MRLAEISQPALKIAAFAYGRMNPPTTGHKKLIDTIAAQPGDHFLFLTHTQDVKSNPLSFEDKLAYAQKMFPNVKIGDVAVKTIIDAMQKLQSMGYQDIIYVAGSDRVQQFDQLLNKYNGKDYQFNSIRTVNAGMRDPDAEGAAGVSASRAREYAVQGAKRSFLTTIPADEKTATEIYQKIRQNLKQPA
jgi:nicotinic acid mononucleotide adenylyltransferase